MKILVTGGAGYIGSHTTLELLKAGHDVVVVDNLCNSSEESLRRVAELAGRVPKFYNIDIRDAAALDKVVAAEKPFGATIHFAALKAVGESTQIPLKYYENNLGGTFTLLKVLAAHDCKNIVFSSSATVYGQPQSVPIREDFPTPGCTNPYGWTKLMMEQVFRDVQKADPAWNTVILRYFNPIGAHESGRIGEAPAGTILSTGYGFGDRESDLPNLLRVTLYEEQEKHACPYSQGRVSVLETNIDDMNPQDYQDLEERLFGAGALDVFFTPILMKKMRPAVRLTCIALIADREKLGEIVLKYSSSIGLRWNEVNRMTLRRRVENFSSSLGDVAIKLSCWGEDVVKTTAEYDDLKRLSKETGRSIGELRAQVLGEYAKGAAVK